MTPERGAAPAKATGAGDLTAHSETHLTDSVRIGDAIAELVATLMMREARARVPLLCVTGRYVDVERHLIAAYDRLVDREVTS
jgi:hypothetical protein